MSKVCNACRIEKNISEFYTGRGKCKDCVNAAARKIKVDSPEKYAKYRKRANQYLKERRYGITQKNFDKMLAEQNNMCKICDNEFKGTKNTHIDHCHDQNKVRGLLCSSCNVSLGQFMDNIEYMYNAIEYLEKYE